jgi:hypothetical protein
LPRKVVVSTQVVWMSVRFERVDELALTAAVAVGTRSISAKPWGGYIPAIDLEGDVVLEQRAGLGAAIQPHGELAPMGGRQPAKRPGVGSCAPTACSTAGHGHRRAQGSHRDSRALSRTDQGVSPRLPRSTGGRRWRQATLQPRRDR